MLVSSITKTTCIYAFKKSLVLGTVLPLLQNQEFRCTSSKHWNPKFKKLRGLKLVKIDLPDFHKKKIDPEGFETTAEEERSHFKELGIQPVRPWHERPFQIACTSSTFEPYVPPEGDGKISALNSAGAKQKIEWLKKKGKSWNEMRKIRKYEEDFDIYPDFVDAAMDIYQKAHEAITRNDAYELIKYATEKALPEMLYQVQNKTIRWKFIKSLEPLRVCHVRCTSMISDDNVFAQITVRFHTQQTLAIYDRFGRIMFGSEVVAKDVLEYVVLEKQLSNRYGTWRIHDKIMPEWLPKKEPGYGTYVVPVEEENAPTEAELEKAQIEIHMPIELSK